MFNKKTEALLHCILTTCVIKQSFKSHQHDNIITISLVLLIILYYYFSCLADMSYEVKKELPSNLSYKNYLYLLH